MHYCTNCRNELTENELKAAEKEAEKFNYTFSPDHILCDDCDIIMMEHKKYVDDLLHDFHDY